MVKEYTGVPGAPSPIGPYSLATSANGLYFISGQVPLDPATGRLVNGGIEDQTRQVMQNLKHILTHAGLGFRSVLKSTIYLTNLDDFVKVNQVYGELLEGAKPARATIQVAALPLGASVEIEMIATFEG